MHFPSLAILALATCAHAEWAWLSSSFTISGPAAKLTSIARAYNSKISEYAATVTTGAEFQSAKSELDEYLATRTGVPSLVKNTALSAVMTYTSKPDWWDAMPSGAKNYFEKELKVAEDRVRDAQAQVSGGALGRGGGGLYVSGALVVVVAGLAIVL